MSVSSIITSELVVCIVFQTKQEDVLPRFQDILFGRCHIRDCGYLSKIEEDIRFPLHTGRGRARIILSVQVLCLESGLCVPKPRGTDRTAGGSCVRQIRGTTENMTEAYLRSCFFL